MELLVTIAIGAILLSMGVPSLMSVVRDSKLDARASDFVMSLNTARSEAVRRNARATVCSSSNGTQCNNEWEDGWIVFIDDGSTPGTVESGEEIVLVNEGLDQSRYTLQGNTNVSDRVSFGAQGYSMGFAGQLALCYDKDGDGTGDFDDDNSMVIMISNSGRVRTLLPSHGDVSISDCTP